MRETPQTEAGRALVRRTYGGRQRPQADFDALTAAILAIEAEAAAAERERLRREVEALPGYEFSTGVGGHAHPDAVRLAAVLALLADPAEPT